MSHREIFTPLYGECSGPGSALGYSKPYRDFIEAFIRTNNIETILDLGCGDMTVMGNVMLGSTKYVGVDVIPGRIEANRRLYPWLTFVCADLRTVRFDADLILCKDVIQHWTNAEIIDWLSTLNAKLALITNCRQGSSGVDAPTGGWRPIDLTKPPFNVGEVVMTWDTKDVVLLRTH